MLKGDNWSIDEQAGTITFTRVKDVDTVTFPLAKAVEMLTWLCQHEKDLRMFMHKNYPRPVSRPLMPVGDFMYGVHEDETQGIYGMPVKVKLDVYSRFLDEQEAIIRETWANNTNEHKRYKRGPASFQFFQTDKDGKELFPQVKEDVTPADMPDEELQDALRSYRSTAFWLRRQENLCLWQALPLP